MRVAVEVADRRAAHASAVVAVQAQQPVAVAHVGAGLAGRVGEDSIEHGAAGRHEAGHAVLVGDVHRHGVAVVVERRPRNRGRAGGGDRREQSPAVQLHDGAAHQRVGGQRVGAGRAALDDEDAGAAPGQEQRRGGAGAAAADDEDVHARRQRCGRHAAAPWWPRLRAICAGEERGVETDAVDEARAAMPQELQAEHEQARRRRDAADVDDLAAARR